MKVRFSADALDAPEAWHYLDVIVFKFFGPARHFWDIPNPAAVKRSRWITSDPKGRWTRQNLAFLEKVVTKQAHRRSRGLAHSLVLCVAMTSSPPLKLTPPDAEHVLGQPVHVVVENVESDGAFITAAIQAFARVTLRNAFQDGLWKLVHAGGSGELEKRVQDAMRAMRTGPPRVLVIKDADRLAPTGPVVAETIRVKDEYRNVHEVRVVVLQKREIENYLPIEALEARAPRERRHVLRAFGKLTTAQRDHYDMKEGFKLEGDEPLVPQEQRALFGDLDDAYLRDLCGGFGEKIWKLFKDSADVITKTTLHSACPEDPDEIERILDTIESLL